MIFDKVELLCDDESFNDMKRGCSISEMLSKPHIITAV